MNFDDLHDPAPPAPGTATLAAVAARAKSLRRRRTALTSVGAALAVAVVAVPVGLAMRGDDTERLVPATLPATTAEPSPTVAPSTSVPATSPTSPTSALGPTPTGPTTTSTPPTTTSAPPTTEPTPAVEQQVLAVTADGGVVLVAVDGTVTDVAFERPGDGLVPRTAIATPSGRRFVGTCCLPIDGPLDESARWGELPGPIDRPGLLRSIAPDGVQLALLRDLGVAITDPDGTDIATGRLPGDSTITDVAFLPDGRVALVELYDSEETGFVGRMHVVDGDLSTLSSSTGVVLGPVEGNGTWQVAGVDEAGNVLVAAGGDGAFDGGPEAFDPDSLEQVTTSATTGTDSVSSVWFEDGVGTWVDMDGALWLDGERIADGPFFSARPAPQP
jgi:hypothetical protein